MNNTELIKGLRWCADESICCDDFSGEKCPYFDEKKDSCSVDEILHAAADALEADDKLIAELEAQLPKEGEWILEENDECGYKWCKWRCSVCREVVQKGWRQTKDGEKPKHKYCPNCGARMKGEQE